MDRAQLRRRIGLKGHIDSPASAERPVTALAVTPDLQFLFAAVGREIVQVDVHNSVVRARGLQIAPVCIIAGTDAPNAIAAQGSRRAACCPLWWRAASLV